MLKYYKLCIIQYCLLVNDYVTYVRYIQTDDLYHYIGYLYCNTLEYIQNINYTEIRKEEYDNSENKLYYKGKQYLYANMKFSNVNKK